MTTLREAATTPRDFRDNVRDISYILGIEASRDLPEVPVQGNTPISPFTGSQIAPTIGLLPILRAGLGMTDALMNLFPLAKTYHLGLFREKVSLQPVEYYSKLPSQPNVDQVFLLDPLIATGGTVCAALAMIKDWGYPVEKVKLLVVLASKEGLAAVQEQFPEVEIWVAAVDDVLTDKGYISPGLGDAGDRQFNTLKH
ncbi:armadillo/beta-catenin/plakoglobin [Clavulina sp. PMI_390]|nr:armadillo/beta-catenin/plakoglobin [Clavulina sp. PMI_390]